jgi:hypothetical protein
VPERRTKVPIPTGMADGFEVPILESKERWTELTLEDGTVLRVKPNIITAIRVDGQYDQDGNPLYALKSTQIMAVVSCPDRLRKDAKSGSKVQ